jgi:hypothetical protein
VGSAAQSGTRSAPKRMQYLQLSAGMQFPCSGVWPGSQHNSGEKSHQKRQLRTRSLAALFLIWVKLLVSQPSIACVPVPLVHLLWYHCLAGYNDQLLLSDEVLDTISFTLPPDQVCGACLRDADMHSLTIWFCYPRHVCMCASVWPCVTAAGVGAVPPGR